MKLLNIVVIILVCFQTACSSGQRPYSFELTLAHLNDTHSHLEAVTENLTIAGVKTTAELGGFARIKTVLDSMRSENRDLLLLHGGDAVQGTLYFTLFNGLLEYDLLNRLGVDAMTFGNHEFDRGVAPIPGWINASRFPWLSANIDFSGEPAIAPLVKPYLIREVNGEKVAIIGVTTETTPQSTLNVGKTLFRDAVASCRQQVAVLTSLGINKIILLSHLGYRHDLALARQVAGIDIVVGGHSHSLLGDRQQLAAMGEMPVGEYPTAVTAPDGKQVLVSQAWQWGYLVGRLQLQFNRDGEITGFRSNPVIPVGENFSRNNLPVPADSAGYREIVQALQQSGIARIVPPDPAMVAELAPYARRVAEYGKVTIATAAEPLVRGLNSGPGVLGADSMLAALPGGTVAILNYGGVRRDLNAGVVTAGDVLEIMPFPNTLVQVDLTGHELEQALEEGIEFLLSKFGNMNPPVLPAVAGIKFSVQMGGGKGERVSQLAVKGSDGIYQPINPQALYRTVVNSFVANGGDGFSSIKQAAGFRSDSGIVESDAFREYLQKLGTLRNPGEERITILPPRSPSSRLQSGHADRYGDVTFAELSLLSRFFIA